MRFTLAYSTLVLVVSLSALSVSARSQRDEGRLGNTRTGVGTTLPNYSEQLQISVEAMTDAFDAARAEITKPSFRPLLEETESFALNIEELYYASISENWSQEELDERSNDIEQVSNRLTVLVNSGTEPPRINVAPLPTEGSDVRIRRLVNLSRRLIPNILFLVGSDAINLNLLNQIRDDLAVTGALARALPESNF